MTHPASSALTAVTLTGVDDHTDLDALVALSRRFPRAEWGVLYSPSKTGKGGRYPAVAQAEAILARLASEGIPTAVHLCGAGVFGALNGTDPVALKLASLAGRIQLNFNQARQPVDLVAVDAFAEGLGKPVITQYNRANEGVHESLGSAFHQVLFDASGGRGTQPGEWPRALPGKPCGFAGGLGPNTVFDELKRIVAAADGQPFWIDMETSLRTAEDVFDLGVCETVLTEVQIWAGDLTGLEQPA